MRRPSIRNPRSVWDVIAVLATYILFEYTVLRITGDLLVRRELVVVGIIVVLWAIWAAFHVLDEST
ncbi:hypothetical protein [Halalkalicoccus sp. NIPERK01]|uniref:hypothetical protein n=1 Tax=Halalkalicoccus sp. NIPERK01 TaxID=3053469 RepID=UPI00256EAB2C|nr:hypothetical protein [Halalkalicoccus sp. NIPERK01]MDL5362714.1 hypothetical protein [Halalkalicoccus sp. NIPERK01]